MRGESGVNAGYHLGKRWPVAGKPAEGLGPKGGSAYIPPEI